MMTSPRCYVVVLCGMKQSTIPVGREIPKTNFQRQVSSYDESTSWLVSTPKAYSGRWRPVLDYLQPHPGYEYLRDRSCIHCGSAFADAAIRNEVGTFCIPSAGIWLMWSFGVFYAHSDDFIFIWLDRPLGSSEAHL